MLPKAAIRCPQSTYHLLPEYTAKHATAFSVKYANIKKSFYEGTG